MYKGTATLTTRCGRLIRIGAVFAALLFFARANGQAASPAPLSPPAANSAPLSAPASASAEMTSQESTPMFKVNVKEVLVRVVARDPKGNAVGNLTKDDFQVFDQGKPQVITHFSVERPGAQAAKEEKTSDENPGTVQIKEPAEVPERFIAYLFDDIHLQFGDLAHVRDAAQKQFATLHPTDRAAIFSTSGRTMLDYTDDRAKLRETLLRLRPNPISGSGVTECPDISYYMADLIVNKEDKQALQVAVFEALSCNASYTTVGGMVTGAASAAQNQALAEAQTIFQRGLQES